MSKTIMAVGGHTGDAQLTSGMLLCKHAMMGDKVVIVDLTAGERGAPAGVSTDAFRERNVASAREFASMLGGESVVFDVPDGELYPGKEIELQLADLMRRYKTDAVLYHWRHSLHKDHLAAHQITENAIFYASLSSMEREYPPAPIRATLCAENWEDSQDFVPYHFFDVTEAFPLWKEAIKKLWLAEHSTSFKYLRYYEALSVCRGAMIGKDHATAFSDTSSMRKIVRDSL